jgi:hypothetical protein
MAGSPRPPYTLSAAAAATTPLFFPASRDRFPSLDDRLAQPETPEEVVRGERYATMGSLDPHADQHFRLDYVLAAHVTEDYVGATDLLTRSATDSDFASDTCIRKTGTDPVTGTRWLEEMAFEIANEQPLSKVSAKAEDLCRRGVRRIFAIFVKTGEVKEWSARTMEWQALSGDSTIEDERCLRKALPVKAVLNAVEADRAVARALVEKRNPVLVDLEAKSKADGYEQGLKEGKKEGLKEGKKEGLKEGRVEALTEMILTTLSERGLPVSEVVRSRIQTCTDLDTLNRWFIRSLRVSSAEEAVAD